LQQCRSALPSALKILEKYMKKQSGFTLIELLLVIAIIGIISVMAVPTILSQRDSARDKAAMSNCTSILVSIVSAADTYVEDGNLLTAATVKSDIIGTDTTSLVPEFHRAGNPWPNASLTKGYAWFDSIATPKNGWDSTMVAAATPLGQVQMTALATTDDGEDLSVGAAVRCKKDLPANKDKNDDAKKVLVKIVGLS
jgi:prepilin-type N-terminal cleavage/methylation domain-containing protein